MKPKEKFFNVVCPKTNKIISKLPILQKKQIEEKINLSYDSFKIWKEINLKIRINELKKFKNFLLKNKEELIDRVIEESSKTRIDVLHEVFLTIQNLNLIIKFAKKKFSPKLETFLNSKYKILFEPIGVVGIISDSKDSIFTILKPSFLALISGNTVIVKPNESNSIALLKILDFFHKAGIQAGIFQVLTGDFSTTKEILKAELISKIYYAGNNKVASEIVKICSEKFLSLQLDLETRNIHIITKSSNLQRTCKAILHSAFFQSGQTKFNTRLVYVEKSILSELIHGLKLEYEQSFETEFQKEKHLSFLNSREMIKEFQETIQDIKSKKGYFIKGGEISKSNFISPCILISANKNMNFLKTNSTLPILTIFEYSSEQDLVRELNNSQFGSEISFWTKNIKQVFKLAKDLEYSSIFINESSYSNNKIFQNGFKFSSQNQEIDEFSFIRKKRIYYPKKFWKIENEIWWFPHSRRIYGYISKAMNFLFR